MLRAALLFALAAIMLPATARAADEKTLGCVEEQLDTAVTGMITDYSEAMVSAPATGPMPAHSEAMIDALGAADHRCADQ